MSTPYSRAIATAKLLSDDLTLQTHRVQAMELCFKKIQESLLMYRGRCVNRIKFHLNRHHSEYMRKVRAMGRVPSRVRRLEQAVLERDEEIERLTRGGI